MIQLLKALRTVRFVDSGPQRALIFEDLTRRSFVLRSVRRLLSAVADTSLSRALYGMFGALALLGRPYRMSNRHHLLTASEHGNELRAVTSVLELAGDSLSHEPALHRAAILWGVLVRIFFRPSLVRRYLRCIGYIERRGEFLTTCRMTSTLCSYFLAQVYLDHHHPAAVVVASNYSPTSVALSAAARERGIPVIYTSHAIIPRKDQAPPLEADFALLYGASAVDAFSRYGPFRVGHVILKGVHGESRPLRTALPTGSPYTLGVFLTGGTNEAALRSLLEELERDPRIERVVIRPHPMAVVNPDFTPYRATCTKLVIDGQGSAGEGAAQCALVIAGNSSVHIEVLKSGTPTCYFAALDGLPYDCYGFVEERIVPELRHPSELGAELLSTVYRDGWTERFRAFDASYLMPGFSAVHTVQEAMAAVAALAQLADGSASEEEAHP